MINENHEIPFRKICFMVGEIIYGGRAKDNQDYALLQVIAKSYFCP